MNWKTIRIIDTYLGIPLIYALAFMRRVFRVRRLPVRLQRKRILLVKFWGIGNIFMMLPSVQRLRQVFAAAEIDLLTLETNRAAAEFVQAFSSVHTVDAGGYRRFFRTTISMLTALRIRDYDLILDFEQFARFSAICVSLLGRRTTIGFDTARQYRHLLYSDPVPYDNNIHVTRSYCSLVERSGAGGSCSLSVAVLPVSPSLDMAKKLAIPSNGKQVVLHVGTSENFGERRWPTVSYAALADLLIERHGARIVLTGLAEESYLAAEVLARVRRRDCVVDASGQLNFAEYLALIRMSSLVVSADTAAVHIASAAGVPVIGLYGPNTPALYGPWGERGFAVYKQLRCSPCITNFNAKTHNCRHPEGKGACMRAIPVEEVYRVIREEFFERAAPAEAGITAGKAPCDR